MNDEPRWLTAEEQLVWRSYIEAATLLEDHLDRQLQRDAGMPHVYYGLLVKLAESPRRRLRMTELAKYAKITRSRLSHAVARLEKNGWVRREDCPSDKRGQFTILTDEGYEVLRRTAPGHVNAVRQAVFDRLTPNSRSPSARSCGSSPRDSSRAKRVRTCPGCAERAAGAGPGNRAYGASPPRTHGWNRGPSGYRVRRRQWATTGTGSSSSTASPAPEPATALPLPGRPALTKVRAIADATTRMPTANQIALV
ncbi:hypothetical protein SVIOM342S_02291 [Streptomyces violaceorubidus]